MKKIICAFSIIAFAHCAYADDKPVLTAEEGKALYRLGAAETTAQMQLKPFQDAAKTALEKLNKSEPPAEKKP